jgi:DNA-binding MarR family transcriptional regulator
VNNRPDHSGELGPDQIAGSANAERDSVDALIALWNAVAPGLDFSPLGVISRLSRVRSHVDAELEQGLAAHGLSSASFAVLATLVRSSAGAGVNQKRLMDELGLTSGTISIRMDRLAAAGLIERAPDPESRRNTLIVLTDRGRELFALAAPAHLANERRVLCALTKAEQETLAGLLRKLLAEFEGSKPAVGTPMRLGLTVAPVHKSMAAREQLGRDPIPALLVRSVAPGSPAAIAGIGKEDLLVSAGGRELRSAAALHAAIDAADSRRPLVLSLLRGDQQLKVQIEFEQPPPPRAGGWSTAWLRARGEHVI